MPHRGGQANPEDQALDLGVQEPGERSAPGQENISSTTSASRKCPTRPFCNACHIGYGWKDDTFDFTNRKSTSTAWSVTTPPATTRKPAGMAGHPAYKPMEIPPGSGKIIQPDDLKKVAQHVGKTSRDTCGACHFFGGGGDGVKHGDMDSSLASPGQGTRCAHGRARTRFRLRHLPHDRPATRCPAAAMRRPRRTRAVRACARQGGHQQPDHLPGLPRHRPHPVKAAQLNNHGDKLNDHTDKVACQTCHIPSFARGGVATKMSWDWSTAGKLTPEGKPFVTKGRQRPRHLRLEEGRLRPGRERRTRVPGSTAR